MQYRLLKALALAVFACAIVAGPASAAPSWAPASSATIHPGVQTFTDGAQCTANFVFYDASNVYLGQAAHCSGTGTATETNGCDSGSLPIGTPVDIGGSQPRHAGLQLVADDAGRRRDQRRRLRVQRPRAGEGRSGRRRQGQPVDPVLGRADRRRQQRHRPGRHRPQLRQLRRCAAASPSSAPSRARASATTATAGATPSTPSRPASPATPGSAFLNATGKALGVLSTVAIAPLAGSNGVGDVAKELAYANSTGGFGVTLAQGTEAFTGPLLPI